MTEAFEKWVAQKTNHHFPFSVEKEIAFRYISLFVDEIGRRAYKNYPHLQVHRTILAALHDTEEEFGIISSTAPTPTQSKAQSQEP